MSKMPSRHNCFYATEDMPDRAVKRCLIYKIASAAFFTLLLFLSWREALWASQAEQTLSADLVAGIASADSEASQSRGQTNIDNFSLPQIFEVSLNMIYPEGSSKIDQLRNSLKELLITGREKEAAIKIGGIMGSERKKSMAYLGYYCRKALPYIEGGLDERARFLSWFLNGYGKSGVVILSEQGIEKIRATGRKRGEFWRFVEDGKVPADKLDRIYGSLDAVYIPFAAGEVFILDIIGSDRGEAALWKVLPGGINKKTWGAGTWEREVTVRGDRLY